MQKYYRSWPANADSMDRQVIQYVSMLLQPDKINMVVLIWFLVKSYTSERYRTVHYTEKIPFCKVSETHDNLHLVYKSILIVLFSFSFSEPHEGGRTPYWIKINK